MPPNNSESVSTPKIAFRGLPGGALAQGAIVFAVSFAVRFAFILRTPLELAIGEPRNVAMAMLAHQGFSNPYKIPTGATAHCAPFLPTMIAGIYSVFGSGHTGELVRCLICAAVLSGAYALLPFFASRLALASSIGFLAGLLCAVFPFKRSSETVSFSDEPFVAVSLLLLALYTAHLSRSRKPAWTSALLYGATWGITFYVSASLLPVFLASIALLIYEAKPIERAAVARMAAVSLLAAVVAVTPWTIRTYRALHAVLFMRSNFGLELSLANSDGARPSLKQNLQTGHQVDNHPLTNELECLTIRNIGEAAYSRRKGAAALRWIREHPLTATKLTSLRILYYWAGDPLDYATAIPNTALSLAGFWGLALLWRREPPIARLLICVLVSYSTIYYFVQTTPRYTLPIHPFVAFAAAYALWRFFQRRPEAARVSTDHRRDTLPGQLSQ